MPPPRMASGTPPGRPAGKVREPWVVVVLMVLTFGIYACVWCWKVSKEVEAHLQQRQALRIMRTGVVLVVAGEVASPLGILFFVGGFIAALGGAVGGAIALLAGWLLVFLGFLAWVAGLICILVGAWRIWGVLHRREAAAGAPKPLSPGWQLAMVLVPYVNIVGIPFAAYRTQSHLNAMWQGRAVQ